MIEVAEAIQLLLNLLVAGAAIAAAIAAWNGLSTWKEQNRWQSDHDLARKLLVALYVRHDAIRHIRNPFGWSSEENVGEDIPADEKQWKGAQAKYKQRQEALFEALKEMYPLMLEAEALWGSELKEIVKDLHGLEVDLGIAIDQYVERLHPNYYSSSSAEEKSETIENRRMMFAGGSKDEFGTKYQNQIGTVETYLRCRLGSRDQ